MAKDLVSINEYKAYKNIKGDADDSAIFSLIPAISDMVKNYCGRTFVDYVSNSKTEYSNGGVSCVFLKEYPIISITSVNESSDNQQTQQLLVEDDITTGYGYFVDYDLGTIQTVNNTNFTSAFHSVEIIYNGGYEEIPEDLKLAMFHLIDYYRKEQFTQRKSLGAHTVEVLESDEMPGHIKRTLDSYRISLL